MLRPNPDQRLPIQATPLNSVSQTIHTDSDESNRGLTYLLLMRIYHQSLKRILKNYTNTSSAWENDLKKSQTDLITKTRAKANKEEIEQCQKEVDSLQTRHRTTKTNSSNYSPIAGKQTEYRWAARNLDAQQSPPRLNEGSVQQMLLRN
jgi:predicted Rossmann fold nucleotide-binding protein DprA/Smf involved in DNA uptake